MMPPPGIQIYLCPRVTLTFDLLTLKAERFMPLLREPLVLIFIKVSSSVRFHNIVFTGFVTDE